MGIAVADIIIRSRRAIERTTRQRFVSISCIGIFLVSAVFPALAQSDSRIRPTVIAEERKSSNVAGGAYLKLMYKCPAETDPVAARVFSEYGAVLAASGVVRPDSCVYENEKDVSALQSRLQPTSAEIRGATIELQRPAMLALLKAQAEAAELDKKITPLDGSVAGKRTFADTVRLWNSRFIPALDYWVKRGRISAEDADSCRLAPFAEQVRRVIEWERQKIYFSTNMSRSIFSSVAPPGTSQHLFLLAFDVAEYRDPNVVSILNRNGWYQTVLNDEPHFTFLGVAASELPRRGLKLVYQNGTAFWIANLPPSSPPAK
jgi:hypothetical protein